MQRALVTTAAAIIVTALAVSTAGCGGSAAAGAPPTVRAPTSSRPATVTEAGAEEGHPVTLGSPVEFAYGASSANVDEEFRAWLERALTNVLETWQSRV